MVFAYQHAIMYFISHCLWKCVNVTSCNAVPLGVSNYTVGSSLPILTTAMEKASSNCLVQTLINADASSNRIRGSLN